MTTPLEQSDPLKPPPMRCTARSKRTGNPCQLPPVAGANVCRWHGGAAPQVQAAARRRLQQATDALAAKLLGIALDDGAPEHVRLAAIRDALDRGGVTAKAAVEVEVDVVDAPWKGLFTHVARDARGSNEFHEPEQNALPAGPTDPTEIVDAELVPDPPHAPPWSDEQPPQPAPGTGLMAMEEAGRVEAEIRAQQRGTRKIKSRRGRG